MSHPKPIKRSPQLAPLSREHHEALMFTWRVRQGLKNGASLDKILKYSLWYWKEHIKTHFFQEEKILLPYIPANHPMADRLKKEHDQIRELLISLDKEADQHTFTILVDLVDKHVRFEERELFGYLEESLSQEELNKIMQQLQKHPVSCVKWEDVFWGSSEK